MKVSLILFKCVHGGSRASGNTTRKPLTANLRPWVMLMSYYFANHDNDTMIGNGLSWLYLQQLQ